MSNKHNPTPDNEDIPAAVQDAFEIGISDTLNSRMRDQLDGFRSDLEHHSYVRSLDKGSGPFFLLRPGIVTMVLLLVLAGVTLLFNAQNSPTWAQVETTFQSVGNFNATIYFKKDALAQPVQLELWVGQDGRGRMREGKNVLFANSGTIVDGYNIETGKRLSGVSLINGMGKSILSSMTSSPEFSLDSLLEIGDGMGEMVPMFNTDKNASKDLIVFDVQSERTREWCRVWVLRESGLPIRLRSHDPRDGESVEIVFLYDSVQPASFFDAEVFEQYMTENIPAVASHSSVNGLAYALQRDPGGKPITLWPRSEPDESKLLSLTAPTLSGTKWSLSDQRGKAIVLVLWDEDSSILLKKEHWLRGLYEDYGGRDDFVMAGVALGTDAGILKKMVAESNLAIPHLYLSGKPYQHSIVDDLSIASLPSVWMIRKDGSAEEIQVLRGQVEGAVLGFTYASATDLLRHISIKYQVQTVMQEDVRMLLGVPEEINETDTEIIYDYREADKSNEREAWVKVRFDMKGRMKGASGGHRVLEPALVTVTIDEAYWNEHIIDKIDLKYNPENNRDCIYSLTARSGNTTSYLSSITSNGGENASPGIPYSRGLVAGIYDITLMVYNVKEYRIKQEIVLREGVELVKNQRLELLIEE